MHCLKGVASAIQLARRRRQRRALLVQRDGAITKTGIGRQRPVLEVAGSSSHSPEPHSAEEEATNLSDSWQGTSESLHAVVPSFQVCLLTTAAEP